jgi:mono/diheme cytochrome c family protein
VTGSMRSFSSLAFLLLGLPAGLAFAQQAQGFDPRAWSAAIRPLVQQRCAGCHNPQRREGGVDLASLDGPAALRQPALWGRVARVVAARQMPPPGGGQLDPAARSLLARWAAGAADYLDPKDPAFQDPGPAPLRRLTRFEYDRTMEQLLGVPFDSAAEVGLTEAEHPGGFDNLAAGLTLPPALLEKYLAAAEKALARAFERPEGRERLLTARPGDGVTEKDAAREVIGRFLRRAYRRAPRPGETDRLLRLHDLETAAGKDWETALRQALRPALVSPYFLFRVEQPAPAGGPARVADGDLAVRLSYFLWSGPPDEVLTTLADQGKLAEPAVFAQQVRRMLADPRARALTDSFGRQWLELGALEKARPSTEFFPAFNQRLRQTMYDETTTFFDRLRTEDRSVLELLDSDYTYLNADLARHYGIPGVDGRELRRVALRPEHRRGGLLGMGSVLALTSHTFRTSPTLRGRYVLDVLLGTPPPPPPANVNQIEDRKAREARSFREVLAQHAGNPACAGCHKKMDPLGFALDNYDAVGAWRESTPERPLDTTGKLPSGESLKGAEGLKQVLLANRPLFTRNLARRMLSYALGRELLDSDELTLRKAQAALERNGFRFSTLVLTIAESRQFQYRRGAAAGAG